MKPRGFSLLEVMFAMLFLVLLTGTITAVFGVGRSAFEAADQDYELGEEAAEARQWLRAELAYTNWSSLTIGLQKNTLAFASADPPGQLGNIQFSKFGHPRWQKFVHYYLEPEPNRPELSRLMRAERPYESSRSAMPWALGAAEIETPIGSGRVVLQKVVSNRYRLGTVADEVAVVAGNMDDGGFKVAVVERNQPHLASTAARLVQRPSGDSFATTGLVDVQLQVAEMNERTGKWTTLLIGFRVFPQN